jgi:hypothetical protein
VPEDVPGRERVSNVLYWLANETACGFYRCLLPGESLTAKGHNVIADENLDLDAVGHCDVLVGQRIAKGGPSSLWQGLARGEGRNHPLVYELDDDVFALCEEPSNPNSAAWPALIPNVVKNLACSDVVTVSTWRLAEVVSQFTSAPVHVIPNAVPDDLTPSLFPPPKAIGWSGSPTHDGDWTHGSAARAIMRWTANQWRAGSPWYLHTIGLVSSPVVDAHTAYPRAQWTHTVGTRSIPEYYGMLRQSFRVGLAPLAPTRFNASKSDLRVLELAALGIPWVASDTGPYSSQGEARGGVHVKRPRDWWRMLDCVTDEAAYRHVLRTEGQKWAATRTVSRVLPLWESALGLSTGPFPLPEQPRKEGDHDQGSVS